MTISVPPATAPKTGTPADSAPGDEASGWSPDAVIEAHGLGKRFDEDWAVRGLDLRLDRGTIFGLFGPSGSGKTTTIRLLLGLFRQDEGEMRVFNTSPRSFRARTRARIGYMPQLFVLYPELSVGENLGLVASLYGLAWLKRLKLTRQALRLVELWEHRRKTADELSGGMRRRLQLASALVHDPELIVLDEPTAGVDPILRARFWEHFRQLRDQGRTIFVTSQYVTEAEYCDRLAMLGRGRIVATGTPREVRQQAMGGEVVELVADGLDRAAVEKIASLDGVREVEHRSYQELWLVVDQARVAIPRVLEALSDSGAEVGQVQEQRPNFDEVFVRLMEKNSAERVD
jgi:ABC-2 type transport system ATP-binding protein